MTKLASLVLLFALAYHGQSQSPTHSPADAPESAPHAPNSNQEHAIQNEKAEESYWHKVVKPDILPVWLGVVVTLGASIIALIALGDLKEQGRALKRQNDMIISKERARLRVDLLDIPREPEDFPAFFIKARVTISGSTEASIRNTTFEVVTLGPTEEEQPTSLREMRGLPRVIRAADAPIEVSDMIIGDTGFPEIFTGASVVYAKGAIHYTDIFEGRWVFRFSRRYKYLFYPEGKIIGGSWQDCGEEGDNGEYSDV